MSRVARSSGRRMAVHRVRHADSRRFCVHIPRKWITPSQTPNVLFPSLRLFGFRLVDFLPGSRYRFFRCLLFSRKSLYCHLSLPGDGLVHNFYLS